MTEAVEERDAGPQASSASRRIAKTAWWVISRCDGGGTEVLTVSRDGTHALPVFGHQEEAELFLWSAEPGEGWRVRESRCGELLSVLYGPCSTVDRVALDPLPESWTRSVFDLFCVGRKDFVRTLLDGGSRWRQGDGPS